AISQSIRKALTFTVAGFGIYQLGQALKNAFQQGIQAVDDFHLTTIGVASTLTDMAEDQTDVQGNYNQALAYAKDMYNELELAAAKFFASGSELIQAWNIMAQKGVVLRKEEINYLGIIVDKIKLLTQGQVGSYQIAQELRAVLTGQARATDQLARLLMDKLGPAWKDVIEEVRKTGSFKPLAEHFAGLGAASKDISETLTSQVSTLWTLIKQVGREGLSGAFEDVVGWVSQLNEYLKANGHIIANDIKQAWADIKPLVEAILHIMTAMIKVAWTIGKALASVVGALSRVSTGMMVEGALTGDFETIAEGARLRAEEKARKEMEALAEAQTREGEPKLFKTKKPTAPGKEAGGGKARTEDLLKYLTDYLEAKRKLELKAAEESYQIFKAEQDRKKAELELALAEGRITGQEYYQTLYEMAQAEADASLKLIDEKIAKEKEAYEWAKKEIEEKAKKGKISPEAQELALKKLAVEHAMRLKELEGDALREKIDLQKENLKLLKEEHANREGIADILTSARAEATLGPIAEKEAEIARLLEEQRKNREELINLGATQAQIAEYNLLARQQEFIARFGEQITGYADIVASGFSDILDGLMEGGRDLVSTLRNLFKNLFNQALKPGMDHLKQLLIAGFTKLFGEVGASVANALMGLIGLIGMLLTGGGGTATWSPAGVEKGVTAHEAVRGIIAGETSIPIAQVSESLSEAVAPHLQVLRQIEANTRGGLGGNINVRVLVEGVKEAVKEAIETYFREYLVMGAEA
ncbi:MAG: hypothetical protein JRI66_12485, partial [Deltaproteobacteria bacterium]|nr:hypothetical protein [Deltaproteobacteria bacterium]